MGTFVQNIVLRSFELLEYKVRAVRSVLDILEAAFRLKNGNAEVLSGGTEGMVLTRRADQTYSLLPWYNQSCNNKIYSVKNYYLKQL